MCTCGADRRVGFLRCCESLKPKEQDNLMKIIVDCVKTMQQIRFICDRAKATYIEEKDIDDILELLKGKV